VPVLDFEQADNATTRKYGGTERRHNRGERLYTTHCIACHSTQMHWRDKWVAFALRVA
jgi:mono/diheme cytochrome c family protein